MTTQESADSIFFSLSLNSLPFEVTSSKETQRLVFCSGRQQRRAASRLVLCCPRLLCHIPEFIPKFLSPVAHPCVVAISRLGAGGRVSSFLSALTQLSSSFSQFLHPPPTSSTQSLPRELVFKAYSKNGYYFGIFNK